MEATVRPDIPQYLIPPRTDGPTFGTLRFQDGYYYVFDAVPAVRELAKRVLPGCGHYSSVIKFRATRRAVGDLNWLMQRYPLRIEEPDRYETDRATAASHAVRRATNAVLAPVQPPPMFKGKLYDFQADGAAFLIANERCLLADDMGLGKTITALAAMATADAFPALVVAPASVQSQWCSQIETFIAPRTNQLALLRGGRTEPMVQRLTGRTPYAIGGSPIVVIHYGLIADWREELLEHGFKSIVFDEIQDLRHTGTQKYSAASLLAGGAQFVWGLSGTPIHNYGIEMWTVTNILDYHCLGDQDSFTREWCAGYGSKIVTKADVLHDHLTREGLMLRRLKSDVQRQLPPKRRVVHFVDHDEDMYGRLIADAQRLAALYDTITDWHSRGVTAAEIDSASRRATGISKARYVAQFVSALIESGERPLVFAWHHDVHDAIADVVGGCIGRITGKESPAQKAAAVEAFAKGNLKMLLLSLRSTAGLDGLQGKATCVVFAELDWSPAVHSQCEDRLHRIGVGELDSVLCYYMVSRTGHDGVVMDALGLKVEQFVTLMGDAPESEEDRALAQSDGHEHLAKVIDRLKERAVA